MIGYLALPDSVGDWRELRGVVGARGELASNVVLSAMVCASGVGQLA